MKKKTLDTLNSFAELKDLQKALDMKVAKASDDVIALMKSERMTSVKIAAGSFSIVDYKTWQYSPDTMDADKMVKNLQKMERDDGTAKVASEKQGVRFIPSDK